MISWLGGTCRRGFCGPGGGVSYPPGWRMLLVAIQARRVDEFGATETLSRSDRRDRCKRRMFGESSTPSGRHLPMILRGSALHNGRPLRSAVDGPYAMC